MNVISYSLTQEFSRSQGKRVRFRPEFRRSLDNIFNDLLNPFIKGKFNPKSAVAADLVTIGDSWLNFAIEKGLIEPIRGAEDQDWFRELSDKWKVGINLFYIYFSCEPIFKLFCIGCIIITKLEKDRIKEDLRNYAYGFAVMEPNRNAYESK